MGTREPEWLCLPVPYLQYSSLSGLSLGESMINCQRREVTSLSSLCLGAAALYHLLSIMNTSPFAFFSLLGPFSLLSQLTYQIHYRYLIAATGLAQSQHTAVYRDDNFPFSLPACLWTLVSLENGEALTLSFLLFTVDCPLLVVLQPHGPFTELAAAFSQVSPTLPNTTDQVRFRHSL